MFQTAPQAGGVRFLEQFGSSFRRRARGNVRESVGVYVCFFSSVKVMHKECLERWWSLNHHLNDRACPVKCNAQKLVEAEDALLSLAEESESQTLETQPSLPPMDIDIIDEQPILQQ